MFTLTNLHISIDAKPIVRGTTLAMDPGSIHALMGPNGSGKSTLAYTLAGHPRYCVTQGSIRLNNDEIQALSPDKRAQLGLLVVFQQPPALPGVRVHTFLKDAYQAITKQILPIKEFNQELMHYTELLQIDPLFVHRDLHDGFSGGEKKRLEMLQILLFKPSVVILDEIDSGLDIDALKIVSQGIAYARNENPKLTILIITHYQRILQYIHPEHVHIFCDGIIAKSGDALLVHEIEKTGYQQYRVQADHEKQ